MPKRSVFIIGGGGMVGATAAHALAIKESAEEIILIDVAEDAVRGQAMDVDHVTAYTDGVRVRVGDYSELKNDDVVVITCGAHGRPGQTRLELIGTNASIISGVVDRIVAQGKEVFIVMVSNPVDVLTYGALKQSGLPKERVFGTGTMLDTARLRVDLSHKLKISQRDIQAFVLGEHGDSSFVALSTATIGGIPLGDFPGFRPEMTATLEEDVRKAVYRIIAAKTATYYGVSNVIATVVEALQRDTARIFTPCSLASGQYGLEDVVLGLPSKISRKGVEILKGYPLNSIEQQQLHRSAVAVRDVIAQTYHGSFVPA